MKIDLNKLIIKIMELKNVILVVIAIMVVALIGIGLFAMSNNTNIGNIVPNNTSNVTLADKVIDSNATNSTNVTVVGDNSPRENTTNVTNATNTTHKVYVPQSDSYVEVIGEKYDAEVNRWYTYDNEGVRYYNTRLI